jgi:hypothetical protein
LLPDATRPSDLGASDDQRQIALAFEWLQLLCFMPAAANQEAAIPVASSETGHSIAIADLMTCFESLGENCEFGLVQRRCGAEPLGLLRFSSSPYPKLLHALHSRFEGMAQPDAMEIQVSSNGTEYMVQDLRYGFYYHAWVLVGEQSPEAVLKRECRRVPFLVEKLIEDLTAGEKVFVYHGMDPLSLEEALKLQHAIRNYGPGALMWVDLADYKHSPGTVEWVASGLLKAYVDRFAPGENAHDLSLDCWIEICRVAHRMSLSQTVDRKRVA